jgi:hypothetical protein
VSLVGDLLFELVGGLVSFLFGRVFHATGRRLIFLFTLGFVRIPSLRHGGVGGEGWGDVGVQIAGFFFWVAVLALTIYLIFP